MQKSLSLSRAMCKALTLVAFAAHAACAQQPYNSLDATVTESVSAQIFVPLPGFKGTATDLPSYLKTSIGAPDTALQLAQAVASKVVSPSPGTPCALSEISTVILHVASWTYLDGSNGQQPSSPNDYSLDHDSVWIGYAPKFDKKGCIFKLVRSTRSDNSPLIRGKGPALFIGIDYFNNTDAGGVSVFYKFSTTAQIAQNVQDLATAITSLLGIASPSGGGGQAPPAGGNQERIIAPLQPAYPVYAVAALIEPTTPAPYLLNISPTITPTAVTPGFVLKAATAEQPYSVNLTTILTGYSATDVTVTGSSCPVATTIGPSHIFSFAGGAPGLSDVGTHSCTIVVFGNGNSLLATLPTSIVVNPVNVIDNNNLLTPPTPAAGSTLQPSSPTTASKQTPGGPQGAQPNAKGGGPNNQGNQGNQTTQNSTTSTSAPIDCTDTSNANPCTFTRSYTVDDKEYWDVSLGVAIPGPVEEVYTSPKLLTPTAPTMPTKTTHTDAYALVDFYFLAHWQPKDAYVPHIDGGITVTSQPFHRPYIGVGLPLTKPLERKGLPVEIDAFGGLVCMKQTIYNSAAGYFQTDHAWKPIWGVEIPIGAITGKLMGSSKGGGGK